MCRYVWGSSVFGIRHLKLRLKQRHISRGHRRHLDPSLDSHIKVLDPLEDMKEHTFPLPMSVVVIVPHFGSDSLVHEVYFLIT